MEKVLNKVAKWSKRCKSSCRQTSYHHRLNNTDKVKITCNDKRVERVKEYKLLGMIIDNFELNSHGNQVLKDGYSTLKLLNRYTPFNVRKQFCESLI